MKYVLFIAALCVCLSATAQSDLILADTLWIHKVNPDNIDQDLESFFPILRSSKIPIVADNMNKVLQMENLGFVLNGENEASLLQPVKISTGDGNFSFSIQRVNDQLIIVNVSRFRRINQMSLNGYDETRKFLFDAYSGQPILMKDFFAPEAWNKLRDVLKAGFRKDFMRSLGESYKAGFNEKDLPAFNQECDCNCLDYIDKSFCTGNIDVDVDTSARTMSFSIPDCDWMNPRRHDAYKTTMTFDQISPMLSAYGSTVIMKPHAAPEASLTGLWKGSLGGRLPITFILIPDACNPSVGRGLEIYDHYGICIPISFVNESGTISLTELDAHGKTQATVTATYHNGMLAGMWYKAHSTVEHTFSATHAGR